MKYYIIGHKKSDSEFEEYEKTTSKERAINAKNRYEKVYKKKFSIILLKKK